MLAAHKHEIRHIGFKGLEHKLAGEGYSKESQGKIAASVARKASPEAKAANPHLKRVKG